MSDRLCAVRDLVCAAADRACAVPHLPVRGARRSMQGARRGLRSAGPSARDVRRAEHGALPRWGTGKRRRNEWLPRRPAATCPPAHASTRCSGAAGLSPAGSPVPMIGPGAVGVNRCSRSRNAHSPHPQGLSQRGSGSTTAVPNRWAGHALGARVATLPPMSRGECGSCGYCSDGFAGTSGMTGCLNRTSGHH